MKPFVSVVTPFYNTAKFLAECIESVLAQTHTNFEYILLDNCSTDGSADIARSYANRDSRIRLCRNETLLEQVDNYNRALSLIHPDSVYCKIVQADDWIYPDCLRAMLEVAETDSRIGIVSSYWLKGTSLRGEGLPVSEAHIPGRMAARIQLRDDLFFLGSPTTVMYRSALVRARAHFYAKGRYHEDTEAGYDILAEHDLGFVHQVLSYQRVDQQSIMGRRMRFQPHLLDRLIILKAYGPRFLEPDELVCARRKAEKSFVHFLGRALLDFERGDFWSYQAGGLATIGERIPWGRVAASAANQVLDLILNPKRALEVLVRKVRAAIRRGI